MSNSSAGATIAPLKSIRRRTLAQLILDCCDRTLRHDRAVAVNYLADTVASVDTSKLSVHWAELTAADFREGIARAQGTCLLPFGILEKHGPHLPLGNDLLNVRYLALSAAQQEYAIVFPEYYFGQIFEAK